MAPVAFSLVYLFLVGSLMVAALLKGASVLDDDE